MELVNQMLAFYLTKYKRNKVSISLDVSKSNHFQKHQSSYMHTYVMMPVNNKDARHQVLVQNHQVCIDNCEEINK